MLGGQLGENIAATISMYRLGFVQFSLSRITIGHDGRNLYKAPHLIFLSCGHQIARGLNIDPPHICICNRIGYQCRCMHHYIAVLKLLADGFRLGNIALDNVIAVATEVNTHGGNALSLVILH